MQQKGVLKRYLPTQNNRGMRILQINNCHYRRGGADVVYLNTGELLEKFGHEVSYFSQKSIKNIECTTKEYFIEPIDFFNKSFIQKILISPRFFYSSAAANKLDILLTKLKPEIAHIHTYKGTLTPSILKTLKRHSIPVIISLHDYGFLCPHNSFIDGKERICTKCYDTNNPIHCVINRCNRNKFILSTISAAEYYFHKKLFSFENHFSHLIGVSKFIYKLHFAKSEFKDKISHLYNFFPDLQNLVPTNYRGNYFLFYGRLSNEKGIQTLLNAWLQVDKSVKLKIVGDGALKDFIVSFITNHNIDNIEYLGFKQKAELFEIIKESSFIIVPSEWYENNPLTIIEAYAYGKPVIGSDAGGIPEIIKDSETGFVFKMGDSNQLKIAIEKTTIISDDEYRRISKNARLFAEQHFSEETHYSTLINLYKRLL